MLYVAAYILTLVIHELVHGIFFTVFGGKPSYGVGISHFLPYAYATAPGQPYSLNQMLIIGLSPFVLLSIVFLGIAFLIPVIANFLFVAFIANFSGAVGDLWLANQILKFRKFKDLKVIDQGASLDIHTDDPECAKVVATIQAKEKSVGSFMVHWIGAAMFIVLVVMLITLIGPYFQKHMLIGPAELALIQYDVSDESSSFTLNVLPPIVGGLTFAALMKVFSRSAKK